MSDTKNISKFLECLINEDYSKANEYLNSVICEKVKKKIKKAYKSKKSEPFLKIKKAKDGKLEKKDK